MGAKGVKRKATAPNKADKLPVRARSNEPAQPEAAKGTMMVFDDDDDEGDQLLSTKLSSIEKPVSRATIPDSEEDEDSDDDEAPEATSTQNIASNAEQLAAAASKAAEELAATQKRKRQERDALFKQQATSRKSRPALVEAEDSDSEESPKSKMPALLPEEFLTDESEPDPDAESFGDLDDRPKRRRVAHVERTLTRLDRGPADERVGSTMFSVAKTKTDPRLPPKMNKNAKHRKDALLQRKRVAVQPKGKFFKK